MFELHITCTKDIDRLKIDFSDGTTIVSENTPKQEKAKPKVEKKVEKKVDKKNDLDYNNDNHNIDWSKYENANTNQKVVKPIDLPSIEDRPIRIDPILQELDF